MYMYPVCTKSKSLVKNLVVNCMILFHFRGVVQLFNAVRKQQKDIDEKLSQVGSSIRKREKVMKSVSKGAFLDMLKGTNANVSIEAENEVKTVNHV